MINEQTDNILQQTSEISLQDLLINWSIYSTPTAAHIIINHQKKKQKYKMSQKKKDQLENQKACQSKEKKLVSLADDYC